MEDYVGAPEALRALEHDIDKAAGTRRWIWYDETTLHERVDAGWTPADAELSDLLRQAVWYDDAAIAKELIDLGANQNGAPDSSSLLMQVRSAEVACVLLKAGADPSRGGRHGGTPLQAAATRAGGHASAARRWRTGQSAERFLRPYAAVVWSTCRQRERPTGERVETSVRCPRQAAVQAGFRRRDRAGAPGARCAPGSSRVSLMTWVYSRCSST